MAVRKMTHHEMKQDDLVDAIEKIGKYASSKPIVVRNVGISAAVVLALGAGVYWTLSSRSAAAAEMLGKAQARFSAPIVATDARPTDPSPSYPNEPDRDRAALEAFNQLVSRYGGRAEGRLGRYYQGVLLNRIGKPAEAQEALRKFLDGGPAPVLAGQARAQLAQALATGGDLDGAAKIYSELAENKESAYPRDWALFYLAATLDHQGKKSEARAAYQKIVTEFPNSPVSADATRHLK